MTIYYRVDYDIDPALLAGQEYILCCNDGNWCDDMLYCIATFNNVDTRYYCVIDLKPNEHMCMLTLQGKMSMLDRKNITSSLKFAIIDSGYGWKWDEDD